jgi:threonine dehydrogenase-like Zn-dependent dehydrogenase
MRAIVNTISPARYLPVRLLARFWSDAFWSRLAALRYETDWPEPQAPSPDWVKIRPTLGGICGSDIAMVTLDHFPDSFAKAFISSPFVLGHESIGRITEVGGGVQGFKVGDRVNVEPTLSCVTRGIDPVCQACREGLPASCHNLTAGLLPPGMAIGFNSATGGFWGEAVVAHKAQLFKVPEALTDEQAVLVDPLACALHGVLRRPPKDDETVLVLGAGIVGIAIVNAIRAIGSKARVIVLARHRFQQILCTERGADQVVMPADYVRRGLYAYFGELFKTPIYKGSYGKPILLGGADVVYDAVGSRNTTEDSLRLVRSNGTSVIVGMGHARWVDWDAVTWKHLTITGVNGRGWEPSDPRRRHSYELVHEMLLDGRLRTEGLLTHIFALSDYKKAFRTVLGKSRSGCVKAAFRI